MDINDWRGIAAVLALVAFMAVVFWAYSSKRKEGFDEAANLPFADEDDVVEPSAKGDKTP